MVDSKYILQIVVEGQDKASGPLGSIGSALGSMGNIAGGIIGAGILQRIADGFISIGSQAISATAQMQTFELGLSTLVSREIRASSAVTSYTSTVRQATEAEIDRKNWLEQQIATQIKSVDALQSGSDAQIKATKRLQSLRTELKGLGIDSNGMISSVNGTTKVTMTLDEALSQAGPKAHELANQLKQIAIQSPYQLGTVQDTFRLAMAFGFASDEAMSFTNGILNMAAGVGASDDMLQRMSYNLAQIRMQGKVTAMDVRQLAMAGLDLNGVLAGVGDQFGLSIKDYQDFNQAISSGKLTWEQFASAFEKYANEQFGGAAQRMSRTFQGLQSTFKDVFILTMPALFGPALQEVTDFLNGILNKFVEFTTSGQLEAMGTKIGKFTSDTLEYFQNLFTALNDAGPLSIEFFEALTAGMPQETQDSILNFIKNTFTSDVIAGFQKTVANVQTAFAGLQSFIATYGPGIAHVVTSIFGEGTQKSIDLVSTKIAPFISGVLVKLSAWFNQNGPLIQTYLENARVVISYLLTAFVGLWAVLEPLLSGAVDLILGLTKASLQMANGDWSGAWKTIGDSVVAALGAIWQAVVAAMDWILGLFGTSLADIGKWFTDTWNGIISGVSTWWSNMITAISTGSADAGTSFTEWLASIGQWFSDAWNNVVLFFKNIWVSIKTAFIAGVYSLLDAIGITEEVRARIASIWDRIVAIAGVLWDRITAAISVGWEAFTKWISGVWESIWTPLSAAFTRIWDTISSAMSAAWNAIVVVASVAWGLLTSTIQTIISKVVGFISPILENIKTTLMTTWENVKITVSTKFTEIVTTVSTKIGEVLTSITGTVSKFIEAGRNIVTGILDGIKENWHKVIDWVLDGIERLLSRIENALDMHSPSRRMERMFENVPLGAAQGIRNTSDMMGQAMNQAVDDNVIEPSLSISRSYSNEINGASASSGSVVNSITIQVNGSDDPDAVADRIFAKLKSNGVAFA